MRTENDLWRVVLGLIRPAMTGVFPDLTIGRAFFGPDPASNASPSVLLHRVCSRRVGFQAVERPAPEETDDLVERIVWRKEDTFQADAMVPSAINDDGAVTAVDIIERLAALLQTDALIGALAAAGIGILRISDIAESHERDETGLWRTTVSVPFILTYTQHLDIPVGAISDVTFRSHRV